MSKKWIDENGMEIPASRVTKTEKLRERRAEKLLRDAEKINSGLIAYKEHIAQVCHEVFDAVMQENGVNIKNRKGNFIWYNFDRTIKIEVSINERLDFDDTLIAAAKEKLDEFLKGSTNGMDEFIRELVVDAFSTRRGKLDVKKVMDLIRYRKRVSPNRYPLFHQAVDLIEQSIRRPESRTYFRIWKKDNNGQYRAVELNFSSI